MGVNKNNNKKNKTKRNKQTKANNARGLLIKLKQTEPMARWLGDGCNPFDDCAFGLKLPDRTQFPTSVANVKCTTVVTVDANGVAAGGTYTSGTRYALYKPGSILAGVITWPAGSAVSYGSNLYLNATVARVVVGGIKFTSLSAMSNIKGTLHICYVPCYLGLDAVGYSFWPTSIAQMTNCPNYFKVPLATLAISPLILPFSRLDAKSELFSDPTSFPSGTAASTGWSQIIYYVDGATGGESPLEVEIISHIEYVALNNANLFSPTPAASSNSFLVDAMYNLGSMISPYVRKYGTMAQQYIGNAFTKYLSSQIPAINANRQLLIGV